MGETDRGDIRRLAFDPAQMGYIETRLWHAYYARHWPRVALLMYRLVRGQLGVPPGPALRAVRHGAQAATAWAPTHNDPERTRRELARFYRVVAGATGVPLDPEATGEAEFDYWKVHRAIVGQEDRTPLIEALARIPAALYGMPVATMIPSATERERAVRLVDRITSGQQAPTIEAWREIAAALVRSYRLLDDAIHGAAAIGHERPAT